MAYGVFFAMFLALVLATNSKQDFNCEHLHNELSALKKFVFNINDELHQVRKKYNNLQEELRTARNGRATHRVISKSDDFDDFDSYPKGDRDMMKTSNLNKRATAYTPTMHLSNVWNRTKAPCGSKGEKGEKGDTGLHGLKGDKGMAGTRGPKGDIGLKGNAGLKGNEGINGAPGPKRNKGTQGAPGQKGDKGPMGITGPMGPKGRNGNIGVIGQKGNTGKPGIRWPIGNPGSNGINGQKGNTGHQGVNGQAGSTGTTLSQASKVSFSVEKEIRNRKPQIQIRFDTVYWNDGNAYSQSSGKFTCLVPGVYLFTLNVVVDQLHEMDFVITSRKQIWRHLVLYGSNSRQSGSVSAMLKLSRGEKVWVQRLNGTSSSTTVCIFDGILLYE